MLSRIWIGSDCASLAGELLQSAALIGTRAGLAYSPKVQIYSHMYSQPLGNCELVCYLIVVHDFFVRYKIMWLLFHHALNPKRTPVLSFTTSLLTQIVHWTYISPGWEDISLWSSNLLSGHSHNQQLPWTPQQFSPILRNAAAHVHLNGHGASNSLAFSSQMLLTVPSADLPCSWAPFAIWILLVKQSHGAMTLLPSHWIKKRRLRSTRVLDRKHCSSTVARYCTIWSGPFIYDPMGENHPKSPLLWFSNFASQS